MSFPATAQYPAMASFPAFYDPDAQAYFTAAGITDGTQKNAGSQLFIDLKAASIFSSMRVLNLFMGGNAFSHSFNAIDLSQGTFHGTVTQNANGITGDGSTGYFDTGYIPFSHSELTNNCAFGVYIRNSITDTTPAATAYDMGTPGTQFNIYPSFSDSNSYFDQCYPARLVFATATNGQLGLQSSSRTSTSNNAAYQRGTSKATNATDQSGLPSLSFNILGSAVTAGKSAWNVAFAYLSLGLTPTQIAALNTAVQNFQTTLSRAV